MRYARFDIAVFIAAFLTFASLCAARTVITTQKCTTRYCGHAVPKVYRTTKTVHARTPYTVTRWKTIVKPATKAITGTKTLTSRRTVTISTVTVQRTVWFTTLIGTWTETVYASTVVATGEITTKTITPSDYIVPTPPGFIPVDDDPDNRAHVHGINRRDVLPKRAPEPVPAAVNVNKYASAVVCTKTILTKTGTSDLWKTTTKTSGTVTKVVAWKTLTAWGDPATTTLKNARTVTETITLTTVPATTTTLTITLDITTYQTTTTTTIPAATVYAACGSRNQGPPVWQQDFYVVAGAGPDPGEPYQTTPGNGSAYDCCVSCFQYAGPEKCIGSVWLWLWYWWEPPCPDIWDETCDPTPPAILSSCTLIFAENKPGTCRRHNYFYERPYSNPLIVSNGPDCARFKYILRP